MGSSVRTWAIACSMGALALQSGCGTMGTLAGSPSRLSTKVYSGVRADAELLIQDRGNPGKVFIIPLIVLDLPLSFAADTILLPFFLIAELFKSDGPSPPEEPPDAASPSSRGDTPRP